MRSLSFLVLISLLFASITGLINESETNFPNDILKNNMSPEMTNHDSDFTMITPDTEFGAVADWVISYDENYILVLYDFDTRRSKATSLSDDYFYNGSNDTIILFEVLTNVEVWRFQFNSTYVVSGIDISKDSSHIAVTTYPWSPSSTNIDSGKLFLFDVISNIPLWQFDYNGSLLGGPVLSDNGSTILTRAWSNGLENILVFNNFSQVPTSNISASNQVYPTPIFLPNQSSFIVKENYALNFYNLTSNVPFNSINFYDDSGSPPIKDIIVSLNGEFMVINFIGQINFYDLRNMSLLWSLEGQTMGVDGISSSGKLLYYCGDDLTDFSTSRLWLNSASKNEWMKDLEDVLFPKDNSEWYYHSHATSEKTILNEKPCTSVSVNSEQNIVAAIYPNADIVLEENQIKYNDNKTIYIYDTSSSVEQNRYYFACTFQNMGLFEKLQILNSGNHVYVRTEGELYVLNITRDLKYNSNDLSISNCLTNEIDYTSTSNDSENDISNDNTYKNETDSAELNTDNSQLDKSLEENFDKLIYLLIILPILLLASRFRTRRNSILERIEAKELNDLYYSEVNAENDFDIYEQENMPPFQLMGHKNEDGWEICEYPAESGTWWWKNYETETWVLWE